MKTPSSSKRLTISSSRSSTPAKRSFRPGEFPAEPVEARGQLGLQLRDPAFFAVGRKPPGLLEFPAVFPRFQQARDLGPPDEEHVEQAHQADDAQHDHAERSLDAEEDEADAVLSREQPPVDAREQQDGEKHEGENDGMRFHLAAGLLFANDSTIPEKP